MDARSPVHIRHLIAALVMSVVLMARPAQAAGIIVNSLADGSVVDACTLRDAVAAANTDLAVNGCTGGAGSDSITFGVSGTITVTSSLTVNQATSLTIDGSGQAVTISGGGTTGVIVMQTSAILHLESLTISNGNAANGGAVSVPATSVGRLSANRTTFSHNHASGRGGAIDTLGPVTISNSTFVGNTALDGAAIFAFMFSRVTVVNSTFSANVADNSGGGIFIWKSGPAPTIINSTFSHNKAATGAGVTVQGSLNLANTIFANSVSGGDCYNTNSAGTINASGVNLIEDGSCAVSGALSGDPKLDALLADNGGRTQTHALLPGSPAFNAGDNASAVDAGNNPLQFDQRGEGFARIRGGTVDIGAFEAPDDDADSVIDTGDNCVGVFNPNQLNTDADGLGDACDPDDDNDGVPDAQDTFPLNPNESVDSDGDGTGNNADTDDDNDGVADATDNCALIANADQADTDRDGIGNVCDDTPSGGIEVVFVSTRDSNPWWLLNLEIYGMRADGTGVVRLTTHPAIDLAPALSPDKSRVLFTSTRTNNRAEVFVMNADGSLVWRLTTNSAIDGAAVWSPDGTRIAFTSTRDGNAEIYTMNADGSGVTRLTRDGKTDVNPAWSRDGRIAFASNRSGNFEIYSVQADGTDLRRLTTHKAEDAWPTWSPDGTKLAFTSTRDGNAELYVMNANGTAQTRLTNHRAIDAEPSWGPTNWILFTSTRSGATKIYAVDPTTGVVVQLTNPPSGFDLSPHW